ncbi:hypothetical protein P7K49_030570, partial [Saguinus oedipus]
MREAGESSNSRPAFRKSLWSKPATRGRSQQGRQDCAVQTLGRRDEKEQSQQMLAKLQQVYWTLPSCCCLKKLISHWQSIVRDHFK